MVSYYSVLPWNCYLRDTAPSVPVDADDTARTILALQLLGRDASTQQLIDHFQSDNGYFRTYLGERDASFSANCNVLLALLYSSDIQQNILQIVRTFTFLCDSWWAGKARDKWVSCGIKRVFRCTTDIEQNSSSQYSRMLLAEVCIRLLFLWDTGRLENFPEELLREKLPITLIQVLNKTMLDQEKDGSWTSNKSSETTAYGVLTLQSLSSLPWLTLVNEDILYAIRLGQGFLEELEESWTEPVKVWIEKVAYGSTCLSEAYCIAAMRASKPSYNWSRRTASLATIPEQAILDILGLCSAFETFYREPHFNIIASAIEGFFFLPQLRSTRLDILPIQKDAKNEYLAYVPFTWVLINNHEKLNLCADLLWHMMVVTVCNFRVDEYMETVVANFSAEILEQAKSILHDLCVVENSGVLQGSDHSYGIPSNISDPTATTLHAEYRKALPISHEAQISTDTDERYNVSSTIDFRATMSKYIHAMLDYPPILNASDADIFHLRCLLHTFLLSHVTQLLDNSRFATQQPWKDSRTKVFASPKTSFYNWAHSTGADSISCPFSFAFLTCLLGATSTHSLSPLQQVAADCFGSVGQKYLAEDFCSHLAVMSRLYNDFGSIVRDNLEGNINSVNFPEFHAYTVDPDTNGSVITGPSEEERLKGDLLKLAECERQNADLALIKLLSDIEKESSQGTTARKREKSNSIRLYAGVAKLYADIYVLRDLSNRVQKKE